MAVLPLASCPSCPLFFDALAGFGGYSSSTEAPGTMEAQQEGALLAVFCVAT